MFIRDILRITFSNLNESERLPPRLVCRFWRETADSLCTEGKFRELMSEKKFLSALYMIYKEPYNSANMLYSACRNAHSGLVGCILTIRPATRVEHLRYVLKTSAPSKKLGLTIVALLQHDHTVPGGFASLSFAAKCDCVELADFIISRRKR